MTRALFLKLYPFYIPNNSIDFCGIYYIVICIRGVLNNETLLNHVKKKIKKNPTINQIHCILSHNVTSFPSCNPIISIIMIITSSSVCYSVCFTGRFTDLVRSVKSTKDSLQTLEPKT